MGRGGGSSILSLDLGEPRGTLVKQKAAEEWACQSMKRNAGGMRAELSRGGESEENKSVGRAWAAWKQRHEHESKCEGKSRHQTRGQGKKQQEEGWGARRVRHAATDRRNGEGREGEVIGGQERDCLLRREARRRATVGRERQPRGRDNTRRLCSRKDRGGRSFEKA